MTDHVHELVKRLRTPGDLHGGWLDLLSEAAIALEAVSSIHEAEPDGWMLVPKEATTAMWEAGLKETNRKEIYRAMLAAAPYVHPAPISKGVTVKALIGDSGPHDNGPSDDEDHETSSVKALGGDRMTGAPVQPLRRATTKAKTLINSLKRMARADDRSVCGVARDAGLSQNAVYEWPERAMPTLTSAMALADAVGYEIVLRRKE